MRYGELANEVRHFTTRYWGPTLDVMASSIELMRLEGLVEVTDQGETPGDAMLRLTQAGRDELLALLGAAVRVPSNDFNKLIVALKLKFLDALDPAERAEQVDALVELREAELARLTDLRATHVGDDGPFRALARPRHHADRSRPRLVQATARRAERRLSAVYRPGRALYPIGRNTIRDTRH